MKIKQLLKTVKLVIMIWTISYLLGIVWTIFCEIDHDERFFDVESNDGFFYEVYNMEN